MANAFISHLLRFTSTDGITATVVYEVAYLGADVPGKEITTQLNTQFTVNAPGGAVGAVRSAVQSNAVALGFTVPNGNIFIPSYVSI